MDAGDRSTLGCVPVCARHAPVELGAVHTQQPMLSHALLPLRLNQPIILFIRLLHAGRAVQKGREMSLLLS